MTPKRRIIPVFVPHLGCPHACVFCNQRRISGVQRPASADDVERAVRSAAACGLTGPQTEIAFYGGSFTAVAPQQQEALLIAARQAVEAGLAGSVRLSTRPDCVDAETVRRLLRFGVETVELGAQSMDPAVLQASGRGHTPEDTVLAAQRIRDAGLHLILQMMTGLPEDTPARAAGTARQLAALRPDGVRIYPAVVIRDTPMYDMWQAGTYRPQTLEEAVELCAGLLDVFDAAGIPVIRLGLNPTAELSAGGAAAGPYHPAFGELVYGRRYLHRAQTLLRDADLPDEVTLLVGRGKASMMAGQNGCNLQTLRTQFGLRRIRVKETELPPWEVRLEIRRG